MNRETIIQIAREAGFEVHEQKQQARVGIDALIGVDSTAKLERFYALAVAAERKECAKWYAEEGWLLDEEDVPAAIRARGRHDMTTPSPRTRQRQAMGARRTTRAGRPPARW